MFGVSRVFRCIIQPGCRHLSIPINRGQIHSRIKPCEHNVPRTSTPLQLLRPCLSLQIKQYSGCCDSPLPQAVYEHVCAETIESLNEYFEELAENSPELKDADISYGVCIYQPWQLNMAGMNLISALIYL